MIRAYFTVFILILGLSKASYASEEEFVSLGQLISELENFAHNTLESSNIYRQEFNQLTEAYGIARNDKNYRDFVRVKLVFEATRDSGFWRIVWRITDNQPNSDAIWKQWQSNELTLDDDTSYSAVAECDELSALFSFLARKLGVKNVGLFWPTWNHTVAVWSPMGSGNKPIRVVIPTSQVFIGENETIGTKQFDPYTQKRIYEYTRKDVDSNTQLPKPLADWMIKQIKSSANQSASALQSKRNQSSKILGGS